MAESSLTFPDIEQLRAFIDYAETPALLMLVGHLTDDVAVLRDEWRPDPDLLPQGNLDRETEAEVRRYCLARLEAFADSGAPLPSRPSASMLQAIGDWGLGGLGDESPHCSTKPSSPISRTGAPPTGPLNLLIPTGNSGLRSSARASPACSPAYG